MEQMVAAGLGFAQPFGGGVAGDDDGRDGGSKVGLYLLDGLNPGLVVAQAIVGEDDLWRQVVLRQGGQGGGGAICQDDVVTTPVRQ